MKHQLSIGSALKNSWPYDIEVSWEKSGETLILSEGTGHGAAGGYFTLAAIQNPVWTEHLRLCDCLWLRDLADEEMRRGHLFTADEIAVAWHEHRKSPTKRSPKG